MKTSRIAITVIVDLIIVFGVYTFVEEIISYGDEEAVAAAVITFGFAVKEWIKKFPSNNSRQETDDQDDSGSKVSMLLITVIVMFISTITFDAINQAENAMDEAEEAIDMVDDLEYRVEDLEY